MIEMKNWIYSESSSEDIVLSCKIKLSRNFSNIIFTDKMSLEYAKSNLDKVNSILMKESYFKEFIFHKLWEYEYREAKSFVDKGIITSDLLKRKERGAFSTNNDNTITIMFNEEDNLRIQCVTGGLNLIEVYDEANRVDDIIEKNFGYAFSEDYGYLTANPSSVGTGLRASVILHLPALSMSDGVTNILKELNKVGMTINSVYSEGTRGIGNIYEVSNSITLGVTEEEIISNLDGVVKNIISEEKKLREILSSKYQFELEDKVCRAYGVLNSAKLLTSNEILELLSSIRLGTEMLMLDVNKTLINKLLIETRDSVIQSKVGKNLNTRDRNIYRADVVKEILG